MDNGSHTLGACLAQSRKSLGLSLRAVEAETKVSNAYLSQLETGKIKTPSPTVLHTLALRYGLAYEKLMELAGYPVPRQNGENPSVQDISLAARLGTVSADEEEALIDFLSLIRKRGSNAS